jgi:predicted Zn-dependent protease
MLLPVKLTHLFLRPSAKGGSPFIIAAMLVTTALSGCQTMKAIQTQVAGGTYNTFDGKLIETADDRITKPVEVNPFTTLLDQFNVEQDGQEVGFNVKNRMETERAEALKGLSARDLELRELQFNSIQELTGEGAQALTSYIYSIVARLLEEWPHDKPEISVAIIRSDNYHASMSDNGILRLNTAVLLNADDEDEVAAVVAHELAHALFQHHNAEDQQAIEDKSFIVATQFAAGWLGGNSDSPATQNAAKALMISGFGMYRINNSILYPGWKRHQEDEADLLAVDLLYRAGYDWERMTTVLERLDSEQKRVQAEKIAREEEIEKSKKQLGEYTNLSDVLNVGLSNVGKDLSRMLDGVGDDHAPASERLLETKLYIQREYMDGDFPPDADTASLQKVVWEGPGFSAIKKSVYGERARILAERGELEEAQDLALKSLNGRSDTDPVARRILYIARKQQGQDAKALLNLELARKDPQAGMEIFKLLRDEYAEQARWDDALQTWHDALLRFPEQITAGIYFPERISLLARAGRATETLDSLKQCQNLNISAYVSALCEEAARPITSPEKPSDSDPGTETTANEETSAATKQSSS